jgi:RNA polymerase sigma factor (sigma-70 family)
MASKKSVRNGALKHLIGKMHPTPDVEPMFKSWMEDHGGIIGRIARSFARNPADVEDLKQEMMLQLWVTASMFSKQSKASTWIYKICLNTALMWHRGMDRRERRIELGSDISQFKAGGQNPAEGAAQNELLSKLYEAIRAMPESDRTLVLMMLDGLAYREIADVTGLTENHVGVALTRARKRLMELMKGVTNELG